MKRQAVTLLAALTAFTAFPAHAQHERSGLSYTTRGASPAGKSELRTVTYNRPDAAAENKNPQEETESPGDRAWEKYKDLAAGTPPIEEPEADESESVKEEETAAPKTGFAGILEQYHKNKQARSEMKTLVVTKPEKPEKPEVEKPETAADSQDGKKAN